MEEVEILPTWSNQVAKNFNTLVKKEHFIAEEVNFQEEFWLTEEYQIWLVSKIFSLKAYCGTKLFTLVFWSLEDQIFCLLM